MEYAGDCIPRIGNTLFGGLVRFERMHVYFINYTTYLMEPLIECVPKKLYGTVHKLFQQCHNFRDPISGSPFLRLPHILKMTHLTAERRVMAIFYWAHILGMSVTCSYKTLKSLWWMHTSRYSSWSYYPGVSTIRTSCCCDAATATHLHTWSSGIYISRIGHYIQGCGYAIFQKFGTNDTTAGTKTLWKATRDALARSCEISSSCPVDKRNKGPDQVLVISFKLLISKMSS